MACKFCQSSQVRKISEMKIEESIEEFFACLRCGKVTARIKLNAPGLPLEESVTEKVTEQFERDEKEQEEDMNATSGNDSEALQQMPIRAEENQGSKQVQKNRPHGRSAMSAAGED